MTDNCHFRRKKNIREKWVLKHSHANSHRRDLTDGWKDRCFSRKGVERQKRRDEKKWREFVAKVGLARGTRCEWLVNERERTVRKRVRKIREMREREREKGEKSRCCQGSHVHPIPITPPSPFFVRRVTNRIED